MTAPKIACGPNRNLEQAGEPRKFRADLFDRLSEVVLVIPPLRERREDIHILVEHFLACQSRRHGLEVRGVTAKALRILQGYDWPGNVRELEKAVSRAVIFAEDGRITPEALGLWGVGGVRAVPAGPRVGRPGRACEREGWGDTRVSPRQLEALRIAAVAGAVRRADLSFLKKSSVAIPLRFSE